MPSRAITALRQRVRIRGREIEAVDFLQLRDPGQRLGAEGNLAFERMQHDTLDEIAEREIENFRESLQHLQRTAFDADARLDSLDSLHGIYVPNYQEKI